MGKQQTKKIDLSGFDEAIGNKRSIDLSAFDNEVKKKDSPQSSPTIGTPSSTGSGNQGFDQWKSSLPQQLQNDTDYDIRGFYDKYGNQGPAANGHLTDEFKKPNHPTFSVESKYSNDQQKGGEWVKGEDGKFKFVASPFNVQSFGADNLRNYFAQNEPDVELVLPSSSEDPIYQTGELNQVNITARKNPMQVTMEGAGQRAPFNFAESSNPVLTEAYRRKTERQAQAQSQRLSQLNQVYDASQGEGSVQAIQQGIDNPVVEEPTVGESMANSGANMVNRLKGTIPRLNIVAADAWENILGKELAKGWYELEGRDINDVRMEAYNRLDELAQQVKPTLGIVNSIERNDLAGTAAGIVNGITSLGSSFVPAVATGGAGLFTEMTGDAIVDFNKTKAKRLGIGVKELYDTDQAEIGIPATIGALSGGLELIGLKGVGNLISKKIAGSALKKATIMFAEANKEGLTEFIQAGLETANNALASGDSATDASKKAVDAMFSKQGLESYLQGLFASAGAGGLGHIATNLKSPESKTSLSDELAKIDMLEMDLQKPELNPQSRSVLEGQVKQSIGNIAEIVDQDEKFEESIPESKRPEVTRITGEIDNLQAVINDPNVSDEVKGQVESQIKPLQAELDKVLKETSTEETKVSVKAPADVNIEDVIELDNGKRGTVTKVEGNQITMIMENGSTFMATPELVEMKVIKPKSNITPISAENAPTQPAEVVPPVIEETIIPEAVETIEPIANEEQTQPLPVQENVEETQVLPATEEVAAPAVPEAVEAPVVEETAIETPLVEEVSDAPVKPVKQEQNEQVKKLDRLAHQNIEGVDVGNTKSNQAREKGRKFTDEESQYNKQARMDALKHGEDIVSEAKQAFGDDYVSGLLDYVSENNKSLTADKKQLIYVMLENDINKQLLEDPDNLTLKKQEKLVADRSRAFGREAGRAVAMGALRQLARVGYDSSQVTAEFFSPTEQVQRNKIEQAVQSTPDDINKEAEAQEKEKGKEPEVEKPTGEKLAKARENVKKAKADFSAFIKKSQGQANSFADVAGFVKEASKLIKAYAELGIVKIEDVLSEMRKDYGDDFVNDNEENLRKAYDRVQPAYRPSDDVKSVLIDAGYGREITVTTKDGKERRSVLDWKKLTGEEGSLDNINKVLDQVLEGKGYTKEEITAAKEALKDEYGDLHASIIEKAQRELDNRNQTRIVNTKILARKLADLYNYGLFEKESDAYDKLLNQMLGVSISDQALFDDIKQLHKSLADLVASRDAKGNRLSDLALSTAEAKIKNDIKKVVQKVAFSSGNGFFKATVIAKNVIGTMQRVLLNTVSQLVENPASALMNDAQVKIQDKALGNMDSKELASQRRELAREMFTSVTTQRGEEYGGVGSPFSTKNAIDDMLRSLSPNAVYQAAYSSLTGTSFLDSSDSAFKIKRTELEFTHNLIRVLTDPSNPSGAMSKQDALQYVSKALTGQSFEESKTLAEKIINDVNDKAGKEILINSPTNITRIANDIVKDNLVRGEKVTEDLVEDSFKAAYTTAGHGLGHESNNFVTKGLQALNRSIETDLNDAIKRKEFNRAAFLNMASILVKNIVNPFAGGGANWTIIGLQKIGLPVQYLDPASYRNKTLDLSTVEGLRDAERTLQTKATLQRANGRTIIAGTVGLILGAAAYGLDDDDDIEKFRKKHPILDKYIAKVLPPLFMYLTSDKSKRDTEGTVKQIGSLLGDRAGGYTDKVKMYSALRDYLEGKTDKANFTTGDLVGNRINFPFASAGMAYQLRDLFYEFKGLPIPNSKNKPKKGFATGLFRRGWADFFGWNTSKPLTPEQQLEEMRKALKDMK